MRKLVLAAIAASLLAMSAGPVPAAAEPGAATFHEQMAMADWTELHGDRGTYSGAFAARFLDEEGGLVTVGAIIQGKCSVESSGNFTVISCYGKGRGKEIPVEDFNMHPLMETASLDVQLGGFDNHVDWTGRGQAPFAAGGVAAGDDWVAAGSHISRDAKSAGKVLGKKVKSHGWLDWAWMEVGAEVIGVAGLDDLENLDVDGLDINVKPGGKLTFHRTYRIPN